MKLIVKRLVALVVSAFCLMAAPVAWSQSAVAGSAETDGMPILSKKSNCSACHAMDKRLLGPSWMDVSRKYKGVSSYKFSGKDYPLEEGIIMKVSKGGAGVWGTMPMPANSPAVKNEDIKALVKYVLGLAK